MATQTLATHGNGNRGETRAQDLLLLLNGSQMKGGHHFEGGWLSLRVINVFPQPRKTFQNIPEFAQSIAENRLLNPITIAVFNRKSCKQYLMLLNLIWKKSLTIEDTTCVRQNGANTYFVLLAGERRYRGCSHLWEFGCENCKEEVGVQSNGSCYIRHFGRPEIEVRLCLNITPLAALLLQLAENTHMPVPPHEEAYAYAELFRLIRATDEKFPVARFARAVGRSPDTIRNSIKFCDLPPVIQQAVENGRVPYGIALEIARIKELEGTTAEKLQWWLLRAVTGNYRVPDFRDAVTRHIVIEKSGQKSLFDIMSQEQQALLSKRHFRKVVEKNTVQALWSWIGYFGKVFDLFESGMLGEEDSPYSEHSPVRVFRKLLEQLERTTPHMKTLLPQKVWANNLRILREAQEVAALLEEHLANQERALIPNS